MKTFQIWITNSSGKSKKFIMLAASKKEAVNKYNKGKWKETGRIIKITEL